MPEDISWRVFRVRMAKETGYSLEYIDNMGFQNIGDFMGTWSGTSKAEEKLQKKAKGKH